MIHMGKSLTAHVQALYLDFCIGLDLVKPLGLDLRLLLSQIDLAV